MFTTPGRVSQASGCRLFFSRTAGGIRVWLSTLLISSAAFAADPSDDLFDLDDLRVKITEELPYQEVDHDGQKVIIMRHQDLRHTIESPYDATSRDCPPFCILPMHLHPGVETIGELEMLEYLRRVSAGDTSVLVIDSRTEGYTELGTIPGSVNITFTQHDRSNSTTSRATTCGTI